MAALKIIDDTCMPNAYRGRGRRHRSSNVDKEDDRVEVDRATLGVESSHSERSDASNEVAWHKDRGVVPTGHERSEPLVYRGGCERDRVACSKKCRGESRNKNANKSLWLPKSPMIAFNRITSEHSSNLIKGRDPSRRTAVLLVRSSFLFLGWCNQTCHLQRKD